MKYISTDSIAPTHMVFNTDSLNLQLRSLNCYGIDTSNTALLQAYGFIELSDIQETQPTASSILVADKDTENDWYLKWIEKDEFVNIKELQYRGNVIRIRRNMLLAQSDWTQSKDISNTVSSAWTTYRQALRDITQQQDFPNVVVWPERPQ